MADPLTLSALGASALTEGIKFLYEQLTELLKRRRERREKPDDGVTLPALAGKLESLEPDGEALERLEPDLRELRRFLRDYADEFELVDPADHDLLKTVEVARRALEVIYRQRITFRGENRPASGPLVDSDVDVTTVVGYAAVVRARRLSGPVEIRGSGKAGEVSAGGQFIGVDIDTIGDR